MHAPNLVDLGSPPISEIPGDALHGEAEVCSNTLLVAAPGNGKTTALRRLYWKLLQGDIQPDQVAVITPTRATANSLRDLLAFDVMRASRWPKARSVHSFAHHIIRSLMGLQPTAELPELVSGAQQQVIIDQLLSQLTGSQLSQLGISRKVIELKGFRQEVRDLLDVAQQHRLEPSEVARLTSSQPSLGLELLAVMLPRYRDLLQSKKLMDSAALLNFATDLVTQSPDLAAELNLESLLVDDLQDIPPAGLDLIAAVARHSRVHAFGDPDASVLGFRAASPEALQQQLQRWQQANSLPGKLLEITDGQPRPLAILCAMQSISEQIPTSQLFRHRPKAKQIFTDYLPDESLVSARFESAEAESRWLAAELRRLHFAEGIDWHEIAVVARSRSELARFESEFSNLGVPSRIVGQQLPLSSQQAAGAALDLIWHAIGNPADSEQLLALMRSPILGLSAIALAKLSRQLKEAHKLQTGELLPSFALLSEAISSPAVGRDLDSPEGEKIARLADVVYALRNNAYSSAHELVSEVWSLLNLAETWRKAAGRAGPLAAAANRNLDSVIHLFAAARRFDDRNPGQPAVEFVRAQRELAIPEDAILPAVTDSRVLLTTPSSLIGRPKVVAIPSLQQGLWPNLRQRGSILGAASLDGYLRGRSEDSRLAARQEIADERRMLYRCIGAATAKVILSARDTLDETPSQFFSQLAELAKQPEHQAEIMNLRHQVGALRRRVLRESDEFAAAQLRLLAEEGVPGAHPEHWQDQLSQSTNSISQLQLEISVSASQLGNFETCPLHWFINAFGGSSRSSEATLGTVIHRALESGASTTEELWRIVESNWSQISYDSEWQANRSRLKARQMLLNLSLYLNSESGQLIESERKVVAELDGVKILGRVDRVELMADGSVQIADIKTGAVPSAKDAASSRQLQLYQLALTNQLDGRKLSGAKLVSLSGETLKVLPQHELTAQDISDLHSLVQGFRTSLQQPTLMAAVTSHCHSSPQGCGWLLGGSDA